jgi:hypothetical protein
MGLFARDLFGPATDAPSSGDGATDPRFDPTTGERIPDYTGPVPAGNPATTGQWSDADRQSVDRFREQANVIGNPDLDGDTGAGVAIGGA